MAIIEKVGIREGGIRQQCGSDVQKRQRREKRKLGEHAPTKSNKPLPSSHGKKEVKGVVQCGRTIGTSFVCPRGGQTPPPKTPGGGERRPANRGKMPSPSKKKEGRKERTCSSGEN